MTDVEKFFKEWGSVCRMLTEKDKAIYSHKELLDFAEQYHQSKVNNGVLDDVNVCSITSTEKRLASAEWSRGRSEGDRQQDRDSYYDFYCGMEKAQELIENKR